MVTAVPGAGVPGAGVVVAALDGAVGRAELVTVARGRAEIDREPPGPGEAASEAPGPLATAAAATVAGETGTPVASSWYGPGMWGNRTACGYTLTTELQGVAHRTLPCGSHVTLRVGSVTVTVPVVDRGPYVYAREFDLTYATRVALGCLDICYLSWLR